MKKQKSTPYKYYHLIKSSLLTSNSSMFKTETKKALLALNGKGGSTPHAIAKYIEEKHKDNFVANEKLIKVKASFKLPDASKEEKKVVPKTGSVKSVVAYENTKKRKKPTTSSKHKSTAVVVPKSKTTVKKFETVVAPKKKKTDVPANKTSPTNKVAHVKKTKRDTHVKSKQPKSIKHLASKRAKKTVVV
ncbi:hypothetical protein MKX01_008734 [Papaver californicum]|nr:hypothetical protein MKX01_008734 [Papaver californicum]